MKQIPLNRPFRDRTALEAEGVNPYVASHLEFPEIIPAEQAEGWRGRWPEAKTHYFELVAVERALARGDDSRFATMLMDFGITELFTGNPMGFEASFDEGLALLKRIDSPNYRSAVDVRANFLARAGRCADAQAAAAAYEQEFREKTGSVEFLADGSCRPVY